MKRAICLLKTVFLTAILVLYPNAYLLFTRIQFCVKAANKVKHITQYVTKPQGILPNRLITAACGLEMS